MDVNETLLPGIGVRYEFKSQDGDLIGVIRRRNGDFEIVQYAPDDPDQAHLLLHLTDDEADAFAQILGAPRIAEKFNELTKELPGIDSREIRLPAGSPFVDRPLGETQARARTGASIVAIVRNDKVIASPRPAEELHADDVLIVIGTEDGIVGVERLIEKG
jgi:TrkA domain protein